MTSPKFHDQDLESSKIPTLLKPSTSKVENSHVNGKEECFITSKTPQPNFVKNATTRLINPAINEILRISKVILENISKELQNKLELQQWNDTSGVINWLKKLKTKTNINL